MRYALDFDDVGAHIGEHAPAHGPGHDVCELDDLEACERAGATHVLPLLELGFTFGEKRFIANAIVLGVVRRVAFVELLCCQRLWLQ